MNRSVLVLLLLLGVAGGVHHFFLKAEPPLCWPAWPNETLIHAERLRALAQLRTDVHDELNQLPLDVVARRIDTVDSTLLPNLNRWVERYPMLPQPRLVRSNYYYSRGYLIRGVDFAAATPQTAFERMRPMFELALADAEAALALAPDAIEPLILAVQSKVMLGSSTEALAQLEAASAIGDESLSYWLERIRLAQPKWFGSQSALREIRSSLRWSGLSRMDRQTALTAVDCALLEVSDMDHPARLAELDKIIGNGPAADRCLQDRIWVRSKLLKYRDNWQDIRRRLVYHPVNSGAVKSLLWFYADRKQWEEQWQIYAALSPNDPDLMLLKAHRLLDDHEWDAAYALLTQIDKERPDHLETLLLLARLQSTEDGFAQENRRLLDKLVALYGYDGRHYTDMNKRKALELHDLRGDWRRVFELTEDCKGLQTDTTCLTSRARSVLGLVRQEATLSAEHQSTLRELQAELLALTQQYPRYQPYALSLAAIEAGLSAPTAMQRWRDALALAPDNAKAWSEFAEFALTRHDCSAKHAAEQVIAQCRSPRFCKSDKLRALEILSEPELVDC